MAENIKVSIVIPVYNTEKYLKECMNSVLKQTLSAIEIICIDDGSTDGSLRILNEYASQDKRVKVITRKNGGYGSAVNMGIRLSEGEYIGIVEPDDYIGKEMYQTLYAAATQYELDVVSSDPLRFYGEGENCISERYAVYRNPNLYAKVFHPKEGGEALQGQFLNQAGLFRRDFLIEHEITLNETPGAAFQDRGFCFLTLVYAERMMVLPLTFYHYRQDNPNSSIAGRDDMGKVIKEYRLILERLLKMDCKYRKFLPEHFRREYESCRYALSRSREDVQKAALNKVSEEFRDYENRGILDFSGMRMELCDELQLVMRAPEEAFQSLIALKDEIHEQISGYDCFVVYGAGVVGKRILKGLSEDDKGKCLGLAVSDTSGHPREVGGYPIKNIADYADKRDEAVVILAVTQKYRDEMKENLSNLGFQNVIIPKSMGANL